VYEIAPDQSIEQVLASIARDRRVESVQRMYLFRVLSDPYYRLQTALHLMEIDAAHRLTTGRGVTVAIIDTGIDLNHPDLEGQVSASRDFVADYASTFTDDIHGTAVAGVVAALANNGVGIIGTAPNAKLMALKACWSEKTNSADAVCDSLTLAQALNQAIGLKADIVNLSLAGPTDPLLYRLIDWAVSQGIIIVAADPESLDPTQNFPASMGNVIAVRAARTHEVAGPPANANAIVAPASDILTTFPQGAYAFISGSSFAAAHVSGVAALLLELQPDLLASQLKKILQTPIGDPALALDLSVSPIVNACMAIAKLRGISNCSEPIDRQAKWISKAINLFPRRCIRSAPTSPTCFTPRNHRTFCVG
ncbi:MAG: S8 family peptidase, partial [Pyrinomonadaceae bacterium]